MSLAQEAAHDVNALARETQNRVSSLITVPAPSGNAWTVPLGVGLTRTTVFNRRPMNLGVSYYHNVDHPAGSAGQQLRLVLAFLYPK